MKRKIESLLARSGLPAVGRRLHRRKSLVLAYHNVVPDEQGPTGDLSLHLPFSVFRKHLDRLCETHEIVSLDRILSQNPAGGLPRLAITFDDAYRGAVTLAVEELAKRLIPATIFVPPGRLGAGGFWWDALAGSGSAGLAPEHRRYALGPLRGDQDQIESWARKKAIWSSGLGHYALPADLAELDQAATHQGITFGSHSWTHRNLTRLSVRECSRELDRSLAWLRERYSNAVRWLAYPYGLFDRKVAGLAAEVGYVGGVSTVGRWIDPQAESPLTVPRISVPANLTLAGLELRGAGLVRR